MRHNNKNTKVPSTKSASNTKSASKTNTKSRSNSKTKTAKKSSAKCTPITVKKFGVVGTKNGQDLELRLVKWVPVLVNPDTVEAKFDLRSWYVDKGVEYPNKAVGTFTAEELKALMAGLKKFAKEVK